MSEENDCPTYEGFTPLSLTDEEEGAPRRLFVALLEKDMYGVRVSLNYKNLGHIGSIPDGIYDLSIHSLTKR